MELPGFAKFLYENLYTHNIHPQHTHTHSHRNAYVYVCISIHVVCEDNFVCVCLRDVHKYTHSHMHTRKIVIYTCVRAHMRIYIKERQLDCIYLKGN